MQVDWSGLPPVGGISIIEDLHIQLHPLRLQVERRTGRRIMGYIFTHSNGDSDDSDEKVIEYGSPSATSPRPPHRSSMDSATPSSLLTSGSEVSQRPRVISRATSFQNLRTLNATPSGSNGQRRLRKSPSSDHLRTKPQTGEKPVRLTAPKTVDADVEEMRLRASRNRTFLHIKVSR